MLVPFTKMHGAGNDFVVLDLRKPGPPLTSPRIAALADRHRGIGCDQLITIGHGPSLRFFNPDGGEAGACGNGTRCVADLLMREAGEAALDLRTAAGQLRAERLADGRVQVDMGVPGLAWRDVPLAHAADTLHLPIDGDPAACSMGNPHVTFFTTPLDQAARLGPAIERHALFPDRVNAGFAAVQPDGAIRLRVWERGAGLTLACGSGACAALVNAHRRGLVGRQASVQVDGGTLDITWREDGHVLMTGPVATAFSGLFDPDIYPPCSDLEEGSP